MGLITILLVLSFVSNPIHVCAESLKEFTLNVRYEQTEARKILPYVNSFRTGDDVWAWDSNNTNKVQYDNLNTLTYDYELERVAMQRAAEIAIYYSHTRPDGTTAFTAYTGTYSNSVRGENIAMGYGMYTNAESVFKGWREDDKDYDGQGHRRNMLGSSYRSIGVGHVVYNGAHYWVQEFSSVIGDTNDPGANDSDTTVSIRAVESIANQYIEQDDSGSNVPGNGDDENQYGNITASDIRKPRSVEIVNDHGRDDIKSTWDCIWFGKYPQKNSSSKSSIKWRVLWVKNNDAFVVSDTILDSMPFHSSYANTSWKKCNLRNWLNNDFYNTAFTEEEQRAILTVNTEDGCEDKVYVLSKSEASNREYGFGPELSKTLRAKYSQYALSKGIMSSSTSGYQGENEDTGDWHTRTMGFWDEYKYSYLVTAVGMFWDEPVYETYSGGAINYGVRPCMHIDLNSSVWSYAGTVCSEETPKTETSKDLADATILGYPLNQVYFYGTPVTVPNLTVKIGGKELTEDVDYTVEYENNDKPGRATITVTGMGEYIGSKQVHFTLVYPNTDEDIDTGTMYSDTEVVKLSTLLGKKTFEEYVCSLDAKKYDAKLSYLLSIMSKGAYDQSKVDSSLKSMGYDTEEGKDVIHDYKDDYTAAYTLAKKKLLNGSWFVIVAIRGSYNLDWATNANLGNAILGGMGKHQGFENEANQIYNAIKDFVGDPETINASYVITGHSQGAGAANLLAVKLYDHGVLPSRVYDYNFACPNVACLLNPQDWNPDTIHDNIFNIGNIEDPVTFLPSNLIHTIHRRNILPTSWGKFGQTVWFYPSDSNKSPGNATGHDMVYYVTALRQLEPFSSFYSYGSLPVEVVKRVIGVHCPVDVTIYDDKGIPVASVVNNKTNYHNSVFGEVFILADGDEKWIMLPRDKDYKVELSGSASGEMKYEIYDANVTKQTVLEEKVFDGVALDDGKEFQMDIKAKESAEDVRLYVVGDAGGITAEVKTDGTEIVADNTDPVCQHEWNDAYTVDIPATCKAEGSESIHCSKCDAVKEESSKTIPKSPHSYGDWQIVALATELAAGQQIRTCSVCGDTETLVTAQLAPTLPKVKIIKPKAAKKAAVVKWKKVSKKNLKKIQGIEIQVATDKSFTNIVKSTTAGRKKTSKKIKGLQSKKTYWVRIRAYKNAADGKHVSAWKYKKVKVK